MEITSFTAEQAAEIAEDFEDLVDTEIKYNDRFLLIDAVMITPSAQRQLYLPTAPSLITDEKFDVIIKASTDDDAEPVYISIHDYVHFTGAAYNFPAL